MSCNYHVNKATKRLNMLKTSYLLLHGRSNTSILFFSTTEACKLLRHQSEVLSHMLNHAHACLKAFCFPSNEYRRRNTCSISRAEGQSLIQPLHHGNIKRCSCKLNCYLVNPCWRKLTGLVSSCGYFIIHH